MNNDEERSLAWELIKDKTTVVSLAIKALIIGFVVFGITCTAMSYIFFNYLSLYDFSSTTYEQSHTVEAVSDDGGDATAVVNEEGEVVLNGDGNS